MYYKYCNGQYLPLISKGSLRFSSLKYFRHLELDDGDTHTGDALEGMSEIVLEKLVLERPPTKLQQEILARSPVFVGEGSQASVGIENARKVQDVGHWFIFCLTTSNDYAGYDARALIADPAELTRCIWENGRVLGSPVPDIFESIQFAPVSYERRSVAAEELDANPMASVFVKRPRYEHQQEFRIAMKARDPQLRDRIDVSVDLTEALIVPDSVSPTSNAPPVRVASQAELAHAITAVVRDYEAAHRMAASFSRNVELPDGAPEEVTRAIVSAEMDHDHNIRNLVDYEFWRRNPVRELVNIYWIARAEYGVRVESDWWIDWGVKKATPSLIYILAEVADRLVPGCLPRRLWWYLPSNRQDELSGRPRSR